MAPARRYPLEHKGNRRCERICAGPARRRRRHMLTWTWTWTWIRNYSRRLKTAGSRFSSAGLRPKRPVPFNAASATLKTWSSRAKRVTIWRPRRWNYSN